MEPLVTVIIPVHESHVKLLPQALASVRNQTLKCSQVVVVNDTGKPLRRIDGAKVLNTRGREGAAVARNMAIDRAKTPFLLFLDADDLLYDTAVETLVRTYADPDWSESYLYGDCMNWDGAQFKYYSSWTYDRELLFRTSLHPVTALVPTEAAQAIGGFDEKIAGWEDWEFWIRLGVNGYCGAKVPMPLIVYRTSAGVSRERHRLLQDDIVGDVEKLYGDYIHKRSILMGCGPGCGKAKLQAQRLVEGLSPDRPVDGQVLLEFVGPQQGLVPFRVDGEVYQGANTPSSRFVPVRAEHVEQLLATRFWRRVPTSALTARRPEPTTVVAAPGPAVQMEQILEIPLCVNCGHAKNFLKDGVCQALVGEGICGCTQYSESSKPKARRKTKARKTQTKRKTDSNAA